DDHPLMLSHRAQNLEHSAVELRLPPRNEWVNPTPDPGPEVPMSAVAADPIPVRALNQVTYCPRLYYLQYVDCVMVNNEHVEAGLFDHRRVDSPDLANKTRAERGAATSRGIALSSEALGI